MMSKTNCMKTRSYLIFLSQNNNPINSIIKSNLQVEDGLEAIVTIVNNQKMATIDDIRVFGGEETTDKILITKALYDFFQYKLREELNLDNYEGEFKSLFSIIERGHLSH